ncbi:MAG: helix-turn-helix domain-containing protein [Methanobacterium sp.]|nr:helix-turn-helix domain-containing protein [Methanobacterium sp.]
MDTARFNIKKHREQKGLRQQDMADKLNMNIRSYQNLESGATKLDLERLAQIADVLETPTEDLLRQDGVYIHQEIRETSNGFVYHYGIEEEMLNRLLAAKDAENQLLRDEIKYLKDKIDQFMAMVGKKE